MSDRLTIALEFLREGKSFTVGDLRLGFTDQGEFSVAGFSNYHDLRNINKNIAVKELREIKILFEEMVAISTELSDLIKGRQIIYNLSFDDYGKGSVAICCEKNYVICWMMNLD